MTSSCSISSALGVSSSLILVHLDDVVLLHLQRLGRLVVVDPPAVEEKAQGGHRHAHPLAVALLEFTHLGGLLPPDVNLVGVLADHLQLDVFGLISHPGMLAGSLLKKVNQA